MSVTKLPIESREIGNAIMQKHVKTLNKYVGRQQIPEFEVFELATEKKGAVEIQVPSKDAIIGIKYGTPVEIIDPVIIPKSKVSEINGKKKAKVVYTCVAAGIKVKGGQ